MAGIGRSISGAWRAGGLGLIALVALLASSCGSSFPWPGHWVGQRNLPLPEGGDPGILATIGKVDLILKENGRFELLEGGLPKSGTFRTEGNRAFLKITHFMDRPIEQQGDAAMKMNQEIELSAQKDGTIVYDDPGGLVKEKVTLIRQKPESQR